VSKVIFTFILVIHGLIHLMGFMKAFKLAEISQLKQSISKPAGIFWLLSTILFLGVAVFYVLDKKWWWMLALTAILISQIIIILSWQDAKFGTIANIIILIAIILGFGVWNFNLQVEGEINTVFAQNHYQEKTVVKEEMLSSLPPIVEKWLQNSGVVGNEKTHSVYLKQKGLIKLKPDQKKWTEAEAEQYITTDKPAFLWKVKMSMMPFLNVFGRDYFVDGKGQLKMKIASLIPVANVDSNQKVNQSSLQRYLAELVWYPSAAISPYIKWGSIDQYTARANMTYKGVSGSVTFHFDEKGDLEKIWALRYKESDENAELKEWIGEVREFKTVNGIKIPTDMDISWVLDGEKFTWYQLKIPDIQYNIK
jgi:hypothetical protein